MFGSLTEKFKDLFASLTGNTKLTEDNISSAMQKVRFALLEADVNYRVATRFVQRVKDQAIGRKILESIKPKDLFVKVVYEELVELMGKDEKSLNLKQKPSLIMLVGLQGSGKTTHAAKLAYYLKNLGKKVLLAGCDLQRPAAILQLEKLGAEIDVPVVSLNSTPLKSATMAYKKAQEEFFDVLIVDTAGRLHIDEKLMDELKEIKESLPFSEVLYVANATMGQDAVKTATAFDEKIGITGTILTMLDGDARAGVALSIKEVIQKPILFEGVGEKIVDLQVFHPTSMADRILGMGDVINLVRRAEMVVDEKSAEQLKKKLANASFTFDDYLKQMDMVKKMGSMKSLFRMMPGMGSMAADLDISEKEFEKAKAILLSMTPQERTQEVEIVHLRKVRIAKGSGTKIEDVNKLIKGFKQAKQLFKHLPKKGLLSNINGLFGG